jgi:hypothetical protein
MREHIFILIRYRGAKKPDKSFPFLGVSFEVSGVRTAGSRPPAFEFVMSSHARVSRADST